MRIIKDLVPDLVQDVALTQVADGAMPCDRRNLSKGLLTGTATAESNSLRPPAFYSEHDIELKLNAPVATLDIKSRHLQLMDGSRVAYDALLLATGAEPVRLDNPGRRSNTCVICARVPTAAPCSPRRSLRSGRW